MKHKLLPLGAGQYGMVAKEISKALGAFNCHIQGNGSDKYSFGLRRDILF